MNEPRESILKAGIILNDKWLILNPIGKGAMGEVYHAHQLNLKRDVAIKVISQEWLQANEEEMGGKETVLQRFQREFQAMAQVRHPNILQIYDYGSCSIQKDEGDISVEYIAMEYVPGATLRFTMSEEGFEPDEEQIQRWIRDFFLPVLDGVQALHTLGIVHRDLKPENILLDGTIPKITDFGLARSNRLKPLSQTADAQGTLTYMPPEQFVDFKRVDHRGDIFSLGRILFEAITGKISQGIIPFKQVKLINPDTSFLQKVDRIIQGATAEDKDQRLDSVEQLRGLLLEAITSLRSQEKPDPATRVPISKWVHPKWIWGGIAVALFGVLMMTLWHFGEGPDRLQWFWSMGGRADHSLSQPGTTDPSRSYPGTIKDPVPNLMGEDGLNMVLVPGGDLEAHPGDRKAQNRKIQINPFYMDENKVSNASFVQFLNEVKEDLVVEEGVIKSAGRIWFLMGEGMEPYEQIRYQHGRFHLKDLHSAAQPVVRVTWYGASAYARHYNKQLPTEDQWIYAAFLGRVSEEGPSESKKGVLDRSSLKNPSANNDHLPHMVSSVPEPLKGSLPQKSQSPGAPFEKKPNSPKNMGGELNEWAVRSNTKTGPLMSPNTTQAKNAYESVILGKPSLLEKSKIRSQFISNRYPWEGFPNVGFRCVIEIRNKP